MLCSLPSMSDKPKHIVVEFGIWEMTTFMQSTHLILGFPTGFCSVLSTSGAPSAGFATSGAKAAQPKMNQL